MTTKRAKYLVSNDEYHFATDDKALKVLDSNNNEIGTFRELGFEGKLVTGGDYRNIKHTGVYRVKGVSGLPSNIPSNKECILTVTSIGNQNNPELTFYRIIGPNGVILENTVSGGNQSGWGSGGVDLRNTITGINNLIGDVNKLQTGAKNMTDAVNELNGKINSVSGNSQSGLDGLKKDSDSRYLFKNGDVVNGDLSIKYGASYKVRGNNGNDYSLASVDNNNTIQLGDDKTNLNFRGANDLTYNGSKVVTLADFGGDLKLDASKLGGIDSSGFLKTQGDDTKNGRLTLNRNGLNIVLKDENIYDSGLTFKNSEGKTQAEIVANNAGYLAINPGVEGSERNRTKLLMGPDGSIEQNGNPNYTMKTNGSAEERFLFQHDSDRQSAWGKGMGFIRRGSDKHVEFFNFNSAENGDTIIALGVGINGEALRIQHSPYIGDHNRRLFLQDEQPTGDVPIGSVWIGI